MEIQLNGETRVVEDGVTVAALVASLDLRPEQVAVEVNRALVPRAQHSDHVLAAGDVVELVTLVGGG